VGLAVGFVELAAVRHHKDGAGAKDGQPAKLAPHDGHLAVVHLVDVVKAGVTDDTVTVMVVRGFIERDAAPRLTLTPQGCAALLALLKDV
jgi:hypothetical protein